MKKLNHYGDFFHKSYTECRAAFLNSIKKLRQNYNPVIHKALKVPSQTDDDLFIDTVHLKTGENNNLVILASGVHGVEGYTGSALQNIFIEQLINKKEKFDGLDFLIIHAVNPWGFKNRRRVNENNVDLNRNFHISEELFSTQNKPYARLNPLLNPIEKSSAGFIDSSSFILKMLFQSLQTSKRFITEAIGVGQYEFEKGVIFGGNQFQKEKEILHPIIEKTISGYETIVSIDLHTGLGKRGELYILNAPDSDKETKELANYLFNGAVVDDDDENFYQEHGAFLDFITSLCPRDKVSLPVMFEFGTINTNTFKGSVKLLINTKTENQGYHYGYKREKDEHRIKSAYQGMFYPTSMEWKAKVVSQFLEFLFLIPEKVETLEIKEI